MRTRKQLTFREQLIAKGCSGDFLDSLLKEYRQHFNTKRRKSESTSTIKTLNRLHSRLNAIAAEIEQVREKPLEHLLCGRSLRQSIGPFSTSSIRSEANKLKEAALMVSRLKVKTDVKAEAVKRIYDYCNYATNGAISFGEIANLLHEASSDIRHPDKSESAGSVEKDVKRRTTTKEYSSLMNLAGEAMRKDTVRDFTLRKLRSTDAK